ncbi:Canalicular multispecific organic anion transporter 1 [Phytophthora fragariae]|uniref:Canalicular multispecific organic anion transporter 1 n=1 Tax=Phytophthora fragariae TaxID=53985 RepID=A0A6A3TIF3_9STRA|nr:Canalicular multispecific organic anion transporter 1 [Phytophthora fragariae]
MASPAWRTYATFDGASTSHCKASPTAQESASCVSRIFLSWVRPLMSQAHKRQLKSSDVWPLRPHIRADAVAQRFNTPLRQYQQSLPRAFAHVFGPQFALTGLMMLVSMLCNLVGPMALNRVVTVLSDSHKDEQTVVTTAAMWVGLVFIAQVIQALADCYTGLQNEVVAIQCISLLKTLLYRKMLRLNASSRKRKSTGDLTNMFTADSESLVRTALVVHQMWLIPLQIAVVSYLLVRVLSVAAFAGIAVIVLMLWLNQLVSKRMHTLQRELGRNKDLRMKKVTEAFKAVSIIKLNAWEEPITARINTAREAELHSLLRLRIMTSLSIVLLWGMPVFISIAAFGTYSVVLHGDLTPAIVFTSLALFLLIQAPLRSITSIVSMAIQCSVALERISSFLRMPELDEKSVISTDDLLAAPYLAKDVIIAVEDGEFAWDQDGVSLLRNVNLEVKSGEFLVIQGTVGCGKSSLCSALLGEMEKRSGTVFVALMVFGRTVIVTVYGIRAARNLFNQMTHSLMHAPTRFFDANPIGRVLTRYGGDVAAVDFQIPFQFGTLAANVFSVGCSLATAAFLIRWKGFLLIPVIAAYVAIGSFYILPARELQRISKTTLAPVLNHMSESVDGVSVIRAFGQVQRFFQTSSAKLDANHKIWYAQVYVSQWFSLRIQLVGSLLLLLVTSSLVLLHRQLDVAIIGLAFSYSLKIAANLEGIIRSLTRIETVMVSPERMQEYIDIEQEAPDRITMMDPPAQLDWPSTGSIVFDKVSFRYKQGGDLVLRNLSFAIQGGQKICIVGRTGAGKSSLTMALFRISELASGKVLIDGVNVGKIGLKSLREKLSIIPQTPVLFKGPLREYLDPFDEFEDEQLWESVREVGLSERVAGDSSKLMMVVEENGENFSVGERQMLCMARALLRHFRIVIFDEATAAIDHDTDQKLQRVIRTAFARSTVLTIAHRLDTILDSDRILVLDRGRLVEFASPAELVSKGKGVFGQVQAPRIHQGG